MSDVDTLSRRTAHALYALVHASKYGHSEGIGGGPHKASEIVAFDEEAISARETAIGLRHAQRLGLTVHVPPAYWLPTNTAIELYPALEDRYLLETENLDSPERR